LADCDTNKNGNVDFDHLLIGLGLKEKAPNDAKVEENGGNEEPPET